MNNQTAVLFVCLGNICRSPMAEGAMREAAIRHGFDCVIDSAGTAAYHVGSAPDPRAIAAAARHGTAIGGQVARQIAPQDFYHFTHIIALDKANLEGIKAHRPRDATAKVSLLLDWLDGYGGQGVPDPYYGGEDEFMAAWELIARAVDSLAGQLAPAAMAQHGSNHPPRSN